MSQREPLSRLMRDCCMNPRSPCRSVSLFSCISQFVWQPWKDNIQTTGMKVFQVRLLTRLVKILGRPNKAVSSGRIAARLIEWHLAGGVQPLAITMNEGVCLAVEVDQQHIQRRLDTGYCDEMASTLDEALHQVREACNQGQPLSIGLIGNAAEVYPELVRRGVIPIW